MARFVLWLALGCVAVELGAGWLEEYLTASPAGVVGATVDTEDVGREGLGIVLYAA